MAKYVLRLVSVLVILFLTIPFFVSLGADHTYYLPITGSRIILRMPDGEENTVSAEEFFKGTAAAFLPDENDAETLRAFCVMINTPRLTESGVFYLTPHERSELFGDTYDEKCELYSSVWDSVKNESLCLPEDVYLSLSEYTAMLEQYDGSYTEKLASLFPGGGLKTEG